MSYVVRMPKLGVEMETGIVIAWHVDQDEAVSADDAIAEIESEKSVAEVEAREDGVLRRVYLDVDDEGPPGTPMGIVAGADEDISELEATVESELGDDATTEGNGAGDADDEAGTVEDAAGGGEPADDAATASASEGGGDANGVAVDDGTTGAAAAGAAAAAGGGQSGGEAVAATTPDGIVKATPKAKHRAAELGVELATVQGTGVQDSVTASDVERAASAGTGERTVRETREFTAMRRTIADRLGQSYREAVHVTVDREVDVERVFAAADAADVSITDVILQGVSETLAEHPEFNGTFDADAETHTLYEEHNVGLAVDVDGGLVTPVLSDVESKTLAEISAARGAMTERVLEDEFTAEDLSGGTFTVSNLGVFGSDSFTPIINPPEIAILGVNRVTERAVQTDRGIEFSRHVTFSLTFDHRVVDGADAARFLTTLDERLQDPRAD